MSNHAPKTEWFTAFFTKKENFFADHGLGPEQISFFKRFLKDAELAEKETLTPFANLVSNIGRDTDVALGLILINLAHENPQVDWYIKNLEIGKIYARKKVEDMLITFDIKPPVAKSICGAFKRLTETPFGTRLNWGYVSDNGDISRTVCNVSDPRVILYGLYVYNEKANAHYEFRLNSFYENVEQDGIPPTRIFGLDKQMVEPLLRGLSAKYPEFINYSDTNDLCKISLREDKTPKDVLDLFKEVK
jgi:phosphoadenosine phosphosulfate reductase